MKKALYILALFLTLWSCQNSKPEKVMDKDIIGIIKDKDTLSLKVKKFVNDFIKKDSNAMVSIFSDNCKFYLGGTDSNSVDKKAFLKAIQFQYKYFSNIKLDTSSYYVETEYYSKTNNIYSNIWNIWIYDGNFTHKKYTQPGHITLRWENNKVVRFMDYGDNTPLMEEISHELSSKKSSKE